MSSEAYKNDAFTEDEKTEKVPSELDGSFDPMQLEAGTLKLSGYTQDGMTRQSSIIKTEDLHKGDDIFESQSDDIFWTSVTCRVIALVILVIITALFIAWTVCMGGHCSSDDELIELSTMPDETTLDWLTGDLWGTSPDF